MVQYQLKLRLSKRQESDCERWIYHLAAVWNFAVRKIELNAHNKIYFSALEFSNLLSGHSRKVGIPSHVLQGVLARAHTAWRRHQDGLARKPRLKTRRNKFNNIPVPDPMHRPKGNRIRVLGLGMVRFHKQSIPSDKIKCSRIVKRASGWYLCLFIDAEPAVIPRVAANVVGIDSGFRHLLTLSTGEKVKHPRELEAAAERLAQAQRGNRGLLARRLYEREANQRKDRNHKLSRRLISENVLIAWSLDDPRRLAHMFGKSVISSGHGQLRQMLSYKSRAGGTIFVEVNNRNSTMTCSACGALTGPRGLPGLKVRQWECSGCGARHDRDINAAVNTLIAGAGTAHETLAKVA